MTTVLRRLILVMTLTTYLHPSRAQETSEFALTAPASIDERLYLDINGVPQHVMIRGADRANPVLLFVHGGPGAAASLYAWKYFTRAGWERHFTVVHWDQQGAGKTFARAGNQIDPSLTLERIAQDGVLVAEALARRLGKPKLVLLGTSWGTAVGVQMVKARPDLFHAYVGTGHLVNAPEDEAVAYRQVLAKAQRAQNSTALQDLQRSGAPPYSTAAAFRTQRKWAAFFERLPAIDIRQEVASTPGTVPADLTIWWSGFLASDVHFRGKELRGPAMTLDLRTWGRKFAVPVFFIQGTDDDITPLSQVQQYFQWIEAPRKELLTIEGAGHNALLSNAETFRTLLEAHVEPLAK